MKSINPEHVQFDIDKVILVVENDGDIMRAINNSDSVRNSHVFSGIKAEFVYSNYFHKRYGRTIEVAARRVIQAELNYRLFSLGTNDYREDVRLAVSWLTTLIQEHNTAARKEEAATWESASSSYLRKCQEHNMAARKEEAAKCQDYYTSLEDLGIGVGISNMKPIELLYAETIKRRCARTDSTPVTIEKQPMKISRPVMVGNINILEASDEQLVSIIRDAKEQLKKDSDMIEISTKFQEKAKELNEVIGLCIKQLDGDE
jgi:hypothetical protein